jgi:eukaryotic-like serine/threonine-protein kinase
MGSNPTVGMLSSDWVMSDLQHAKDRPRTGTRLRYVAAGMEEPRADAAIKTIGRYEILKVLGKGAMGVVYKARDPLLDRIVAVKTIVAPERVGKRGRSAYLERFQREARAAAKMQHPAIVTIFDVGSEGDHPFMVLEYLPGESLADRLDQVRMPLGMAVTISKDLASALAFAHKERIVHRDVKPANVLHAGEGRWKLADFGIARLPNSDLTQAGIFMGTPGYAPPEAIREGLYTPQADVFAWGAVLYELLSGRIPYEGPDTPTTNGYVLRATARSPRTYDDSIPEPLAKVVMQALEPDPRNRFKTASEAEHALTTAWEQCLNEALVHPSVLAKPEVAHSEVRGPMHVPTHPALSSSPAARPPARVVIESDSDVDEDEPTKLVVRDRVVPIQDQVSPPRSASEVSVIVDQSEFGPSEEEALVARARAAARSAPGADKTPNTGTLSPKAAGPALWVWVVIVVVAAVVGGTSAFYFWRM